MNTSNNTLQSEEFPYISTEGAALLLATTPEVLRKSRVTGELFGRPAPTHLKIGVRKVLYKRSILIEWIEKGTERSQTGEAA